MVLKPDYRGHGSSEGTPVGASYWAADYTVDVLNAFSSLRQSGVVNPTRVGMWGHSMGGHITLRAMTVNPNVKASVIWAGVVAPCPLSTSYAADELTRVGAVCPSVSEKTHIKRQRIT